MQTINVGLNPNDGSGDTLRDAFIKVKNNFDELVAIDASFSGDLQTLNTIINNGSTLNHTHIISQIIGLQAVLDSKVSNSTFNTQILAINTSIQAINSTLSTIIDIISDLQVDVNNLQENKVPYTGATSNVDLGMYDIFANRFVVPLTSGGTINLGRFDNENLTSNFSFLSNLNDGTVNNSIQMNINAQDLLNISTLANFGAGAITTSLFMGDYLNLTSSIGSRSTNIQMNEFINLSVSNDLSSNYILVDVDNTEFFQKILVPKIRFYSATPQTAGETEMVWNDTDGTVDLGLKGGNVTLQLGQEQLVRVVNKTGSDLLEANYQAVRVRTQEEGGAQGQRLAVLLAQADSKANHTGVLGLVTENINNNQEGFITTFGLVRNIDTTGDIQGETWLDGDVLWLSDTVAGGLTNIEPLTHAVQIGYVVYAHQNNGKIFVKIQDGVDELQELHDVDINQHKENDGLFYDGAKWVNKNIPSIVELNPMEMRANSIGSNAITRFGYPNAADVISGLAAAATGISTLFGRQPRVNFTTTDTAGNIAFFRTTANYTAGMSSNRVCEWLFGSDGNIVGQGPRAFIGFQNSFIAPSNVEPTTLINIVGIAKLSNSENWTIIHNDNAGLCTSINLGDDFPSVTNGIDLIYFRMIFNPDNTVSYLVKNKTNGAIAQGIITSNLPSNSTPMYERIWVTNNTTNAITSLAFSYRMFTNNY